MAADVVLYFDPSCPHCRRAKEYLENHHIPFEARDVTTDPEAQDYLQKINAPGVPVIRIGEEHVIGFDQTRIEALLKSAQPANAGS